MLRDFIKNFIICLPIALILLSIAGYMTDWYLFDGLKTIILASIIQSVIISLGHTITRLLMNKESEC